MKNLRLFLSAVLPFFILCGSYAGNTQAITLGIVVPAQSEPFSEEEGAYIAEKLIRMASANGIEVSDDFSRFFIAARLVATPVDFVVGPPSQITQEVAMTLYIADYFEHKVLASVVVNAEGVGADEGKSVLDALQNMPDTLPVLQDFFENGLRGVLYYYSNQGDRIIQQARVLAAQHRYDEALFHLINIPEEAGEVYGRAQKAITQILQQYADYKGEANVSDFSARAIGEAYGKSQQPDVFMKWLR